MLFLPAIRDVLSSYWQETAMSKITLLFIVVALAGCATRQERVAAIQAELPQLVTACNGAFRDGRSLGRGIVTVREGIEACDRLAFAGSLDQVRPATAEVYEHYKEVWHGSASPSFPDGSNVNSGSASVGVQAWAPQMPLPSLPVY